MTAREKKRAARLYVYRTVAVILEAEIPNGSGWLHEHGFDLGHVEEAVITLADSLRNKSNK